MRTIDGQTLRARLAAGERLWLVHDESCSSFRLAHVPGAIAFFDLGQATRVLRPDDVIIVYGLDETCSASRMMAAELSGQGFADVWWYSGGLQEWIEAGAPVEGSLDHHP